MASTIGTALGNTPFSITGGTSSAYNDPRFKIANLPGTYTLKQILEFFDDRLRTLEAGANANSLLAESEETE